MQVPYSAIYSTFNKSWVMQHHAHCTTLNIVLSFIKHRVHVWGEVCWGSFDTGRWTEECCYVLCRDDGSAENEKLSIIVPSHTTHIPCHLPISRARAVSTPHQHISKCSFFISFAATENKILFEFLFFFNQIDE